MRLAASHTVPRMSDATLMLHPSPDDSSSGSTTEEGRTLPSNVEAEAAFLGAVLIDNSVYEELPNPLRPEHFFVPAHRLIMERVLTMMERGATASPVTLKPYFEGSEHLEQLGGTTYLARLTADGHGLLATRQLAEQIYDLALLRELVTVGRTLVNDALDTSETVEPLKQIETAEAALYEIAEGTNIGSDASSFKDASIAALKLAQKAMNSDRGLSGRTTGLSTIDDKTAGLHNSDLVILAGRPGMGKTSLATNIAFNTAYEYLKQQRDGGPDTGGAPVAFFSLEMSADQLATRILAEQAEISSENLRSGDIGRDEFTRLSEASQRLADLPLYIDDTAALSIDALRMRARRLKRKNKIGLVVVDYLQLLQGSARSKDNRVNEISEISRGLKTMAKELDLPVIALSQLSRAVEQREDKKPQLSDLRESGSIEQDADMVWFIYRAEYYEGKLEPEKPSETSTPEAVTKYEIWQERMVELKNRATLIVAKQRHGSTGNVPLLFQAEYTKFSSPSFRDYSDYGEE